MQSPAQAPTAPSATDYDVVILGGAFSGSSLALLLKRARPRLRILIVEKSSVFDRKVGESTSDVAGCFLTRVLGISNHLSTEHFQKHGLRLWFTRPDNSCASACTEIGPFAQGRVPTFQLDRSKLDRYLLDLARQEGCEVLRPATVKSFELAGAGHNTVTVKEEGKIRKIRAGWIADCSGRASLIARSRGTWRSLPEHPVHSMWVRFSGVRCLDSHESRTLAPGLSAAPIRTTRGSATNHLMGHGWWSWIIPLGNGDYSAGVTWDERLFTPPSDGGIAERVHRHLLSHPIGKLMFDHAVPAENDARIYKNLPFYSSEVAGDGWILAGDAAGFMDPLYSQGLDYCAHATFAAHQILVAALDGQCVRSRIETHNREFAESYRRWFEGVYRNKYQYLGDADLMRAAFLLDIAAYFIGPVRLVYASTEAEFSKMPYHGADGARFGQFMAFYNRRLELIARKRLANGSYGKNNCGQRYLIKRPFEPSLHTFRNLLDGVRAWLRLELETFFISAPAEIPVSGSQSSALRSAVAD
jgi:flavin-dependent dehydrogenase